MSKEKNGKLYQEAYGELILGLIQVATGIAFVIASAVSSIIQSSKTPESYEIGTILIGIMFIVSGFGSVSFSDDTNNMVKKYKKLKQKYNSLLQKQNP